MMYTYLQQREIDLGKAYGLSCEQIALYANPRLNHVKMSELRSALEWGVPSDELQKLLVDSISFEEIKNQIENYKKGGQIFGYKKKKHKTSVYLGLSFLLFFLALIIAVVLPRDGIPYRVLKRNVLLSFGEHLDVKSLVQINGDVKVKYPTASFKTPGEYLLEYVFLVNKKELREYVSVQVFDDVNPTLELAQDQLSERNCIDNVTVAHDNVDGDMKSKVSCYVKDGVQYFFLKDSSGNESSAKLQLPREEKVVDEVNQEKPIVIQPSINKDTSLPVLREESTWQEESYSDESVEEINISDVVVSHTTG